MNYMNLIALIFCWLCALGIWTIGGYKTTISWKKEFGEYNWSLFVVQMLCGALAFAGSCLHLIPLLFALKT